MYRLLVAMAIAAASVACNQQSNTMADPPPPAGGGGGGGGTGVGNCTGLVTAAPPAVGGTLTTGTTAVFVQGGTYLLPTGSLRLIGTGAGSVSLTVAQGSTRGNAPFTFNFTGPGSLFVEPFQTAPQSVTMSLCTP